MTDGPLENDLRRRLARYLKTASTRAKRDRACILLRQLAHEIVGLETGETTVDSIRGKPEETR